MLAEDVIPLFAEMLLHLFSPVPFQRESEICAATLLPNVHATLHILNPRHSVSHNKVSFPVG